MSSIDSIDWIPVILITFLAGAMATMVFLFSKLPRKFFVSELNVYPIKSCGPMKVRSAKVTDAGFAYDRFAQMSDSKGNYLTPREKGNERLFHVNPTIIQDEKSPTTVHLRLTYKDNDKEPYRIHDLNKEIEKSEPKEVTPIVGPKVKLNDLGDEVAKWISDVTRIKDCRLTAIGSGYQRSIETNPKQGETVPLLNDTNTAPPVSLADEAPFLLTTTASLDDLNARLAVRGKQTVAMERFRPNIVVRGTYPWEEDTWKRIKIGSQEFEVWQRCGRCAMTTINRETLERGPEPLATLSSFRERSHGQRNFGMHLIPVLQKLEKPSNTAEESVSFLMNVGDTLEVLEYSNERLEEWKRLFDPR